MPTIGGPVYQPTTVSYEPRSTENGSGNVGGLSFLGPPSSIGMASPLRIFRKPAAQLGLLLFALLSTAAGLAMLASGTVDLIENQEYIKNQLTADLTLSASENNTSVHVEEMPIQNVDTEVPVGILFCGALLICLGFFGLGLYIKVAEWRHNCVCPCSCALFDKKQSLARQLQCQNGNGSCGQGIMALNPSTDPLVSHTQYAPVSELPSSSLKSDDEERRNLMPDNKDCLSSAEESDRMLEPDPRIVLRPMGRVEDA